jgi:NADH:ubiquinone oxidoreductase subunit E
MTDGIWLDICINRRITQASCGGRGAEQLADKLEHFLQQHRLDLPLNRVDCLGRCEQGPNLRIGPEGVFITLKSEADFTKLLAQLDCHNGE